MRLQRLECRLFEELVYRLCHRLRMSNSNGVDQQRNLRFCPSSSLLFRVYPLACHWSVIHQVDFYLYLESIEKNQFFINFCALQFQGSFRLNLPSFDAMMLIACNFEVPECIRRLSKFPAEKIANFKTLARILQKFSKQNNVNAAELE